MAQKVDVVLIDDLDGSVADETVAFALDGATYELDLTAKNAAAMRTAVGPYVLAARRVDKPATRGPAGNGPPPFDEVDPKAVRAWAASNRIELPGRGRIPASVLEGFREAGY